jgi:histidinol-phosphate aminotransferase
MVRVVMTAPRIIERYQETRSIAGIDLSDNTNLWGLPPSASSAIGSGAARDSARYPSAYSLELKRALASHLGVQESMIVTGCGSDDVLDSAIRAFGSAGDTLAQLDPTFSMIRSFAGVSGLSVSSVHATPDKLADWVADSGARLIYLCSPNNPTGAVLSSSVIESIVARAQGLVIIDEAYIDFGGTSSIGLLGRYDNVLVTRTLSKAFGLAGFRVGYGVGSPHVISQVEIARGPYKVSALSERVAIEVIVNDGEWVRERAADAILNRQRLSNELRQIGYSPLESCANFLLVPVNDARHFEAEMRIRGVAVRAFSGLTGIGDALRITVGPWPMMERCLQALCEVRQ